MGRDEKDHLLVSPMTLRYLLRGVSSSPALEENLAKPQLRWTNTKVRFQKRDGKFAVTGLVGSDLLLDDGRLLSGLSSSCLLLSGDSHFRAVGGRDFWKVLTGWAPSWMDSPSLGPMRVHSRPLL